MGAARGRLEPGETPEVCLGREIAEETGLSCTLSRRPVDAWVFEVQPGREVFILTYRCFCPDPSGLSLSGEHTDFRWFSPGELDRGDLPAGYRRSILRAMDLEPF